MAWDYLFDNDGDYIDDGAGGFKTTETAQPAVRHQEHDELGEWVGDTTAGRRRNPSLNAGQLDMEREASSYRDCFAVLEAEGLIADVEVTVERDGNHRFVVANSMRDLLADGVVDFEELEEFGD